VESLREIDQSSELALFQGEDKRQSMQLLEMERKFHSVEEVYTKIEATPAENKLDLI